MLPELNLSKLLFFDVETVSEQEDYHLLSESTQALWKKKHDVLPRLQDEDLPNSYKKGAAVYAEFGKIVCISCGIILDNKLEISSFYSHNESKILSDFSNFLQTKKWRLCGHNIKEFDIPYICRRMLIHGLALPECLNIAGKKPWEVDVVDTLQLCGCSGHLPSKKLDYLAKNQRTKNILIN